MCSFARIQKCLGFTLDGQNPCCPAQCRPPPGHFTMSFPPDPPRPPRPSRWCPPPPPRAGCYVNSLQPKNYQHLKYPAKYCPCCCTRPCCRHYRSKENCCRYDDPCKAHCYNHPPGMKPSGRYPPPVYKGPLRNW